MSTVHVPHRHQPTRPPHPPPGHARALSILGDSSTDGRASDDQNTTAGGHDPLPPPAHHRHQRGTAPSPLGRVEQGRAGIPGGGQGKRDVRPLCLMGVKGQWRGATRRPGEMGCPCSRATITSYHALPWRKAACGSTATRPSQGGNKAGEGGMSGWIRGSGRFDVVVRNLMNVSVYSARFMIRGNYLHPNPAGCAATADEVDLSLFERFRDGVGGEV